MRSPDIATRQTDDGHERVWSRLISVTGGDQRSQYSAGGETGCDGSKGRVDGKGRAHSVRNGHVFHGTGGWEGETLRRCGVSVVAGE